MWRWVSNGTETRSRALRTRNGTLCGDRTPHLASAWLIPHYVITCELHTGLLLTVAERHVVHVDSWGRE
jgi:hypothetical protein